MACLDTSTLIDLNASGKRRTLSLQSVAAVIARREPIYTTRFSEAELLVGVERAPNRLRELAKVQKVMAACIILEFEQRAAGEFGRIKAALLAIGRPSGDLDMLIAAVCIANGQNIITRNPKHFVDVPGLVVESY